MWKDIANVELPPGGVLGTLIEDQLIYNMIIYVTYLIDGPIKGIAFHSLLHWNKRASLQHNGSKKEERKWKTTTGR
jgi:hypothetical protein